MTKKSAWLLWGCFATIVVIWGSNWLVIKVGLGFFPPFAFAGLRFLGGGILVLFLAVITRASFPSNLKGWLFLGVLGLLNMSLSGGLIFYGQQYLPSGLGSLIYALAPFTTALAAHFVIAEEGLNWRRLAGIVLGFLGVAIVLSEKGFGDGSVNLLAAGAILLSTFVWAIGVVWFKKSGSTMNPLVSTAVQMLSGAVCLLVVSGLFERSRPVTLTSGSLVLLAYMMTVGTGLAFVVYFGALRFMPATTLGLVSFLVPIVAVLMGAAFLAEPLSPHIALAIPLVGVGLFLVQRSSSQPRDAANPSPGDGTTAKVASGTASPDPTELR
jgi:drug/metabolite transporter (DMT)-like permease